MEKPKLLYSSALLVNKDAGGTQSDRGKQLDDQLVHIDFDVSRKETLSK